MRHRKQPRWSRASAAPAGQLEVGWYGLASVGDGWTPVMGSKAGHTLILAEAAAAGATHAGYWSGRDWLHVEVIADL